MGSKLVVRLDDEEVSLPLYDKNNVSSDPGAILSQGKEDHQALVEMIDTAEQTINDPGFMDLSSLSALKNVNPAEQSDYVTIPSEKASFTEEEKSSLQKLIKKLAEVSHTHIVDSEITDSTDNISCVNYRHCNHYTSCNNCCHNGAGCDNCSFMF